MGELVIAVKQYKGNRVMAECWFALRFEQHYALTRKAVFRYEFAPEDALK